MIFPRRSVKERTIFALAVGGKPQKQGSLHDPLSRSRSRIKDFASPAERVGVEDWVGAGVTSRRVGVGVGGASVLTVGVDEGGGVGVALFLVWVGLTTVICRMGTGVPVGLSGVCACVGLTEGKAGGKVPAEEVEVTPGEIEQLDSKILSRASRGICTAKRFLSFIGNSSTSYREANKPIQSAIW
jgi:hypothetical protein